jgi:tetratricopeptide (TPR) repeat protein
VIQFGRASHRHLSSGTSLVVALVAWTTLGGCGGTPSGPGPGLAGDSSDRAAQIAALQQKAMERPDDAYWMFRIAEVQLASGDAAAAETALGFALQRESEHAPSLALLSKIYYDSARHAEAVELLESAQARTGSLPDELVAALALQYEAIGRVDLSDRLADSLGSRLADWSKNGSAVAFLRLKGNEFRSAEDVAKHALEADPKSAVNHNNFGIAKLYAGDPEAARKSFLTAVELDPELPGPLYNLAIVDRFYFFDDDHARDWFTKYQRLSDDDPDGLASSLAIDVATDSSVADPPGGTH